MTTKKRIQLTNIGLGLIAGGIVSSLLYFINKNFLFLLWMDFFGETVGWIFRGALVVIGLILYFKFQVDDDDLNFDAFDKEDQF